MSELSFYECEKERPTSAINSPIIVWSPDLTNEGERLGWVGGRSPLKDVHSMFTVIVILIHRKVDIECAVNQVQLRSLRKNTIILTAEIRRDSQHTQTSVYGAGGVYSMIAVELLKSSRV